MADTVSDINLDERIDPTDQPSKEISLISPFVNQITGGNPGKQQAASDAQGNAQTDVVGKIVENLQGLTSQLGTAQQMGFAAGANAGAIATSAKMAGAVGTGAALASGQLNAVIVGDQAVQEALRDKAIKEEEVALHLDPTSQQTLTDIRQANEASDDSRTAIDNIAKYSKGSFWSDPASYLWNHLVRIPGYQMDENAAQYRLSGVKARLDKDIDILKDRATADTAYYSVNTDLRAKALTAKAAADGIVAAIEPFNHATQIALSAYSLGEQQKQTAISGAHLALDQQLQPGRMAMQQEELIRARGENDLIPLRASTAQLENQHAAFQISMEPLLKREAESRAALGEGAVKQLPLDYDLLGLKIEGARADLANDPFNKALLKNKVDTLGVTNQQQAADLKISQGKIEEQRQAAEEFPYRLQAVKINAEYTGVLKQAELQKIQAYTDASTAAREDRIRNDKARQNDVDIANKAYEYFGSNQRITDIQQLKDMDPKRFHAIMALGNNVYMMNRAAASPADAWNLYTQSGIPPANMPAGHQVTFDALNRQATQAFQDATNPLRPGGALKDEALELAVRQSINDAVNKEQTNITAKNSFFPLYSVPTYVNMAALQSNPIIQALKPLTTDKQGKPVETPFDGKLLMGTAAEMVENGTLSFEQAVINIKKFGEASQHANNETGGHLRFSIPQWQSYPIQYREAGMNLTGTMNSVNTLNSTDIAAKLSLYLKLRGANVNYLEQTGPYGLNNSPIGTGP